MRSRGSAAFVLVIAVAAVCSFYALDRVPPGIYWDEAVDGRAGIAAVHKIPLIFHTFSAGFLSTRFSTGWALFATRNATA